MGLWCTLGTQGWLLQHVEVGSLSDHIPQAHVTDTVMLAVSPCPTSIPPYGVSLSAGWQEIPGSP